MLMRDAPPAALLAEADGEAKPIAWIRRELLGRAAPKQGGGVRDLGPGGDVQLDDLELAPFHCHSKNGGHTAR